MQILPSSLQIWKARKCPEKTLHNEKKMTQTSDPKHAISWIVSLKDLSEGSVKKELELTKEQRRILSESLEISALDSFLCRLELIPLQKQRYKLVGQIFASFNQLSAISLNPIPMEMNELFTTEFWPASQNDPEKSPELEIDYADEVIEFYEGTTLDIGQVVYEQFVVSIDQYPRAEGEALEPAIDPLEDSQESPFAVLKTLKDQQS